MYLGTASGNYVVGVEYGIDAGDYHPTNSNLTPNTTICIPVVRLRVIRSVVERERAQTAS